MIPKINALLKKKKYPFIGSKFTVKLLGNGAYNTNYLIEGETKCVFRVNTYAEQFSGYGLQSEFDVLNLFDGEFSPKPLVVDATKKEFPHIFLIESFAEGTHPEEFTIQLMKTLAHHMAIIHNKKFPKCGAFPGKDSKYVLGRLLDPHFQRDSIADKRLQEQVVKAKAYVEKYQKRFETFKRFSLLHSDIHLMNLLDTNGHITLLDWEYADIGDPAEDIAVLFCFSTLFGDSPELSDALKEVFFAEYQKHIDDPTIKERVEIQQPIIILLQSLWFHAQLENKDNIPEHIRTTERLRMYEAGIVRGLILLKQFSLTT